MRPISGPIHERLRLAVLIPALSKLFVYEGRRRVPELEFNVDLARVDVPSIEFARTHPIPQPEPAPGPQAA